MKNKIIFYPTLDVNSKVLDEICPQTSYVFSFESKNGIQQLHSSVEQNTIKLDIGDTYWNFDDFNLVLAVSVKLKHLNKLFGKFGIAPSNSLVGVFLEWYSSQSKIRGLIKSQTPITKNDEEKEFLFTCEFPKKRILGSININISFFLKESDKNVDIEEKFLNNKENVLLGLIDEKILLLNGVGSLFPVRIESLPDEERLWKVSINYDDPYTTLLSDGMVLVLNSNHKQFSFINPESPNYCDKLANEIVCESIAILLFKLKEDGYLDSIEETLDMNGSIMSYASYCKNTMGIQFGSPRAILDSLWIFSEKEDNDAV